MIVKVFVIVAMIVQLAMYVFVQCCSIDPSRNARDVLTVLGDQDDLGNDLDLCILGFRVGDFDLVGYNHDDGVGSCMSTHPLLPCNRVDRVEKD